MTERPGILRRIFSHAALLANIAAIIWLLLCLAAGYISPQKIRYLALCSLTTPFALIVNLFFGVFWLFTRRKIRALGSLVALVISYKLLLVVFGWNFFGSNDMGRGPRTIKVMTWNIHGFGIYDKPQNPNTDDQIIDFVQQQAPDIVFLPEFYTVYNNALKPYSTTILKKCGYKEFRFKFDNTIGARIYVGTAIYSKYPIREFKDIKLSRFVYLLQADVKLPDNQTLRTYFIHLESFHLSDGDKDYIEGVKHRSKEPGYSKFRNIAQQFGKSYFLRARQADSAAALIAQSPYPTVICGDFNDLPGSYTYNTMKGKFSDAFSQKGRGFGRTFNLFLPTIRIDYILYDAKFLKLKGCVSPHTTQSDHNPVIANFELPQAP